MKKKAVMPMHHGFLSGKRLEGAAAVQVIPGKGAAIQYHAAMRSPLFGKGERTGVEIGDLPQLAAHRQMNVAAEQIIACMESGRIFRAIGVAMGSKERLVVDR